MYNLRKRNRLSDTQNGEQIASAQKENVEIEKAVVNVQGKEPTIPRWNPTENIATGYGEKLAEYFFHAMSGNNPTPNPEWVRLNVGGKVYQTTKSTLSTHPESFLARLAYGNIPSEKDQFGAFLIDRSYEHFDTILNYFRSGVVNLDPNEKAMKDLLCEADFYNIQPLIGEIQKTMRPLTNRTEMIIVSKKSGNIDISGQNVSYIGCLKMSEKREDYDVLQALQQKVKLKTKRHAPHYIASRNHYRTWMNIELTLRNFGFVKEEISAGESYVNSNCVKFTRTIYE